MMLVILESILIQSFSFSVDIQLSNTWVWVSLLIAKIVSKMSGKVMINATVEIMIVIVLSSNSTKLMKIDTNNSMRPMNSEFRITLYNGLPTCFFSCCIWYISHLLLLILEVRTSYQIIDNNSFKKIKNMKRRF